MKQIKSKIFTSLLVVSIIISLAGCGSANNPGITSTDSQATSSSLVNGESTNFNSTSSVASDFTSIADNQTVNPSQATSVASTNNHEISSNLSSDSQNQSSTTGSSDKLSIVTTLFPQYDFARQIAGDKATVTLLLTAGMESHSFEPTAADIIAINKADIFIYTGNEMEAWVGQVLDSIDSSVKVVDLSQGINLLEEDDNESSHEQDKAEHEHSLDPHIWTSPINAKKMVSSIAEALCAVDNANSAFYQANLTNYQNELDSLDAEFRDIVSNSELHTLVFGGRFAFHYFTKEYGLDYISAYDSCSSETEPSAKVIANIIDYIKQNDVPVVYYEELTDPQVAKSISEATGCDMLLLHSCHNVSKTDFENGVTYISLMKQNAENLKKGLKYNGQ